MSWSNKVGTWKYTIKYGNKKEVIDGNLNLKGTYQGRNSQFYVSLMFKNNLEKLNEKLKNENLYFRDDIAWWNDIGYTNFYTISRWAAGNRIIKSIHLIFKNNKPAHSNISFNYQYNLYRSLNTTWNNPIDTILGHIRKVNRAKERVFLNDSEEILKLVGEYYIRFKVKKEDIYMIMI